MEKEIIIKVTPAFDKDLLETAAKDAAAAFVKMFNDEVARLLDATGELTQRDLELAPEGTEVNVGGRIWTKRDGLWLLKFSSFSLASSELRSSKASVILA